jgi:hypothetical protein
MQGICNSIVFEGDYMKTKIYYIKIKLHPKFNSSKSS